MFTTKKSGQRDHRGKRRSRSMRLTVQTFPCAPSINNCTGHSLKTSANDTSWCRVSMRGSALLTLNGSRSESHSYSNLCGKVVFLAPPFRGKPRLFFFGLIPAPFVSGGRPFDLMFAPSFVNRTARIDASLISMSFATASSASLSRETLLVLQWEWISRR